jgi:tetratricopeptide (TPR) repeat protein
MKKLICLLLTLPGPLIILACINERHVTKKGADTHRSSPGPYYYNEPDKSSAAEFLIKYDLENIQKYNSSIQSDIAVSHIYLGNYNEALTILKRLQKENPEDYDIAANLGTVYELTGNNGLALQYIKKGMELNPQSHEGSEWVHVKILEAKLKMAKDPAWLDKNRVLNTGVSFLSDRKDELAEKIADIEYQLKERVPFTPFPNRILGNIFDELGDLCATQQSIELAYIAYDFSLKYDPSGNYGVKGKMEQLKPLLRKNNIPIPGWKEHYIIRKNEEAYNEVATKAIEYLTKENIETGERVVSTLWDKFSGNEEERRKEQQRKKTITWLIIGGAVLAIAGGGFILYRRSKKQAV